MEIVIPCMRPEWLPNIIKSFSLHGPPALITVVSNLDINLQGSKPCPVRQLRYTSNKVSTGPYTVGLKRNIGAWWAKEDKVLLFDDDQLSTPGLVANMDLLLNSNNIVYGHHRFWDYSRYSPDQLLNVNALDGISREYGVNRLHGWQSAYAGLVGFWKDYYIGLGGTDLWWSNIASHEDQDFARRMCLEEKSKGVFVHEPPVAIHPLFLPEHRLPITPEPSNLCNLHNIVTRTLHDIEYQACTVCPWHAAPRGEQNNRRPLMPFNPLDINITEHWL